MEVVFAHLLNDYSGSPLILSLVIKAVRAEGIEADLYTCGGEQEGFLSNLDVNYYHFPYRFFVNKYIRLVAFMSSQAVLFFKILWRYRNQKDVVFYVNTLLPLGAGLAGKILGRKVVYHIHEVSIKPPVFKKLLKTFADKTASEAIYVSNTLMEMEALPNVKGKVVYNGISNEFIAKAQLKERTDNNVFRILMLCSLKDYKGVPEFVTLAHKLPQYEFELVINATNSEIKDYFGTVPDLPNLTIYPVQKNVHLFYQRANLVLNLSHPETWIETFGMTILEAMYYGIPCIVPPIGGPIELIEDGKEGFLVDQRNFETVIDKINLLAGNSMLCQQFSENALQKAKQFTIENMTKGAINAIIK